MLRLFAALPVPPALCQPLLMLQKNLTGARWRPEENFHITLCFYGEISEAQAHDLDDLLGDIESPPFTVALEGAGWFGRREPTAVWARVRETDELAGLAARCERAARRLNIRLEKRPFTPHVTLAYCQGTPLEDARAWSERHQGFRPEPWQADQFHLYASYARANGPSRYVAEADYPLIGVSGREEMY
jgi:RNA 2',3'-cyclic 3'-phosphodiesterase